MVQTVIGRVFSDVNTQLLGFEQCAYSQQSKNPSGANKRSNYYETDVVECNVAEQT